MTRQGAAQTGSGGGQSSAAGSNGGAKRPRGTGADYVYESLKGQVLDLVLSPGTLLDETDLSKRFGVSRSPVREALIRLAAEGLVQTLRNRTSIVAPFDIAMLPGYFDAMQLLYRLTARLAATKPDAAKLKEIRQIEAAHEAALERGDMRAIVRHNRDFHTAIAEMSGNTYYVTWMGSLLDQGQRILRLYAHHRDDSLSIDVLVHHRELIAAIAAGDPDAAEKAGLADANMLIRDFRRTLGNQPTMRLFMEAGDEDTTARKRSG